MRHPTTMIARALGLIALALVAQPVSAQDLGKPMTPDPGKPIPLSTQSKVAIDYGPAPTDAQYRAIYESAPYRSQYRQAAGTTAQGLTLGFGTTGMRGARQCISAARIASWSKLKPGPTPLIPLSPAYVVRLFLVATETFRSQIFSLAESSSAADLRARWGSQRARPAFHQTRPAD